MEKPPFVRAADVEGERRDPPRVSKLLLAPKYGGVKNVSMGMNITEVGSMIPDHVHDESEEVLFLISGRAKIVIEGDGETRSAPRPPSTRRSARSTASKTSATSRCASFGSTARPCRRIAVRQGAPAAGRAPAARRWPEYRSLSKHKENI